MNSWDLFDTLIAARNPNQPAGDQDLANLFPISENIAKVQAGDVIVSDYYNLEKAQVCVARAGLLRNRLYVTEDGKRTGTIWQELPEVKSHTGDNPATDGTCVRNRIAFNQTTVACPTALEDKLRVTGLPGLANLVREARLRTYNRAQRDLEDIQTQGNFPMLLCASVLLHRRAVKDGITDILLASRDAYLWVPLMKNICQLLGGTYRVHYWLTSRLARVHPSSEYIKYTNDLMGAKPLVVDMCGWGHSIFKLLPRTAHPDAPVILCVKYPHAQANRSEGLTTARDSMIERPNLAMHAMVVDVKNGEPIYSNPANIQWDKIPQIQVMHAAFETALSLVTSYDFTTDLKASDDTLRAAMNACYAEIAKRSNSLDWALKIMMQEEPAILREMDKQPPIKLAIRLHGELPFLGMIGQGDGMTAETLQIIRDNPNIHVAAQSATSARDFEALLGKKAYHLQAPRPLLPPTTHTKCADTDNVACFGSMRSLKNHLTQAAAAIIFSRERNRRLRFHVNDYSEYSTEGKAIGSALKALFAAAPNAELVLHKWLPRDEYLKVVRTMDLGLQVSLTECNNTIACDYACAGIPLVVSREIKWAVADSIAYPTNVGEIVQKMHYAIAHPELVAANRAAIEAENAACWEHWQEFLDDNARVLILIQNSTIDTGIKTSGHAVEQLLRDHNIDVQVAPTAFQEPHVKALVKQYKPTHVISEASFAPAKWLNGECKHA